MAMQILTLNVHLLTRNRVHHEMRVIHILYCSLQNEEVTVERADITTTSTILRLIGGIEAMRYVFHRSEGRQ